MLKLRFSKIVMLSCLAMCGHITSIAQAQFALFLDDGGNVQSVSLGGTATVRADALGVSKTATLTVSYRGNSTVTITSIDRTGSGEFAIAHANLPVALQPNQDTAVTIQYLSSSGSLAQGRITFGFQEGQSAPSSFSINLAGRAPELIYSYLLPGGNAVPLAPGGALEFPQTPVNSTGVATFVIANRGSSIATIDGVSWSGDAFELTGLPLPPTTIDPGRDFRFSVQYLAPSGGAHEGSIVVEQPGLVASFQLLGTSPSFGYQMILNDVVSPINPGSTTTLPDTELSETTAVTIVVTNEGESAAMVNGISLVGPAYSLSQLPILPANVVAGGSLSFQLSFSPTQIGRQTARLQIDNVVFEFEGRGLGAQLDYRFSLGGTTVDVPVGGSVLFNPTSAGSSTTGEFSVVNSGSSATSIVSIGLTAPGSAFNLSELPNLPLDLQPGATFSFDLEFTPAALGANTATLQINDQRFPLSGTGTQPPDLPAIDFSGPEGDQPPLTQPEYTIALAELYPLPVQGTLTLSFTSEVFLDDPALQFATGGRTVPFTIPANTTNAVFPNDAGVIALQTGSLAGTITLTPRFQTAGGINLTPSSPPRLSLRIAKGPPGIISAQVGSQSANQITLSITGYATDRTVTQIKLSAVPVPGENINNGTLTVAAEPAFLSWFQSNASNSFGSLYTASLPITIGGSVSNAANLIDAIQSFSVVLVNDAGESAPFSLRLR